MLSLPKVINKTKNDMYRVFILDDQPSKVEDIMRIINDCLGKENVEFDNGKFINAGLSMVRKGQYDLLEISVADMFNKPIEHIPRFSIYVDVCFETTLSMELRFLRYELIIQPNIGVQPIKMQFKYTSWVNKEASLIDVMMPFFANGFNEKRERSLRSKTESVEGLILLEYFHDIKSGNVIGKEWEENGSFGGYKSIMVMIDKVSWDYEDFIRRCLKKNRYWDYE